MNEPEIREIVRRYRQGLEEIFGDQLVAVLLYGSWARGEAHEESDIDVVCVLRPPFDYGEAIRLTSALTARLSLAHDVAISRVFISEEDWRTRHLPFYVNLRREGAPV